MTDTDICNMALSYIGKGTIVNRDEDIEDARACNLFYDAAGAKYFGPIRGDLRTA